MYIQCCPNGLLTTTTFQYVRRRWADKGEGPCQGEGQGQYDKPRWSNGFPEKIFLESSSFLPLFRERCSVARWHCKHTYIALILFKYVFSLNFSLRSHVRVCIAKREEVTYYNLNLYVLVRVLTAISFVLCTSSHLKNIENSMFLKAVSLEDATW